MLTGLYSSKAGDIYAGEYQNDKKHGWGGSVFHFGLFFLRS